MRARVWEEGTGPGKGQEQKNRPPSPFLFPALPRATSSEDRSPTAAPTSPDASTPVASTTATAAAAASAPPSAPPSSAGGGGGRTVRWLDENGDGGVPASLVAVREFEASDDEDGGPGGGAGGPRACCVVM